MENARFLRSAALWCAIGSLLNMILGLIGLLSFELVHTKLGLILEIPIYVLMLAGLVGLARSGATGNSGVGKVALGMAILGWTLFIPGEMAWVLDAKNPAQLLFGIGTLLNALGMIGTGFVVLGAKRWQGWQAFTPLLWGLHPFVVQFPAFAVGGWAITLALGSWGICSLLLSVALWQEAGRAVSPALPGSAARAASR